MYPPQYRASVDKYLSRYGFVAVDGREESKNTNLFLYADNIKDPATNHALRDHLQPRPLTPP